MNPFSTESTIGSDGLTGNEFPIGRLLIDKVPDSTADVPSNATRSHANPARVATMAVVATVLGAMVTDTGSKGINPIWVSMASNIADGANNYAADFIEPVEFKWTKRRHRIRMAVKQYSEETHADY